MVLPAYSTALNTSAWMGTWRKIGRRWDGRSWKGQYKRERIISGLKAQLRLEDVEPHPSCAVGDTDFVRTETRLSLRWCFRAQ